MTTATRTTWPTFTGLSAGDEGPISVNPANVLTVQPTGSGARITLRHTGAAGTTFLRVREDWQDVIAALAEAQRQ